MATADNPFVPSPDATPEDLRSFRHTFVVNYLLRGGNMFHLQKGLGHSCQEMTHKICTLENHGSTGRT